MSSVMRAATHTPRAKFPLPVSVFTGVVATAVVGIFAYAGYSILKGATIGYKHDANQKAMFRALDHSKDGVLQLDPSLQKQEFIHFQSHKGNDDDSMLDDYWTVEDESAKLVAADTDHNSEVTKVEYLAFLKSYDANGNDRLNFKEAGKLEHKYPTVVLERHSWRPDWDYPRVPSTPLPSGPGDS